MTTKKHSDEELWQLVEGLDFDLLDPSSPISDVDAIIREAGGDPVTIGKRGASVAAAHARKRRLAWMVPAAAKRDAMAKRARQRVDRGGMDRPALLAEVARFRSSPVYGQQVLAVFRGRRPEEASDEALRDLLDDFDAVVALSEDDDGDAGR